MKFVVSVVAVALLLICVQSTAHELGARVELPSKFERFVVPIGGVRMLQYYPIGSVDGQGGTVRFRVGRISAMGQPAALLALEVRVSVVNASSRPTQTGFVDADELESLSKALREMDGMFKKRLGLLNAETAEAEFAAGSVRIGTQLTNRQGDRDRFLVAAGYPSRVTATLDPADLSKVLSLVLKAIDKVSEVEGSGDK